jgi:hypothetical protein
MRTELLQFNDAVGRVPVIDAWMKEHAGGFRLSMSPVIFLDFGMSERACLCWARRLSLLGHGLRRVSSHHSR